MGTLTRINQCKDCGGFPLVPCAEVFVPPDTTRVALVCACGKTSEATGTDLAFTYHRVINMWNNKNPQVSLRPTEQNNIKLTIYGAVAISLLIGIVQILRSVYGTH